MIGAPTSVAVKPGEFTSLTWEDGSSYKVPGVSRIESALHAGRLAIAQGLGPVALSFRPHQASGPVLICTANLAGRPLGVDPADQKALFDRLLGALESMKAAGDSDTEEIASPAADLNVFLSETGGVGAAVLLSLWAVSGDRTQLNRTARELLGLELAEEDWEKCLKRLPENVSVEEIEKTLHAHGWSAHLRRMKQVQAEG
jgi:hypothetical protein